MNFKNTSLIILLILLTLKNYAQNPKKILFIGNSMTYFNDMPNLFESIANEKGKNVDVSYYAPGGTGFVNHHTDNQVYSLLQNNNWEAVILQPGTSESAGVSWPVNTTAERGNRIQDSIKKYSPCAKVFLYQIPYGVPSANNYANYFQVQTKIKDSITKLADLMHIPMIAAGECARQHYTTQQDLLLHNSYNDVHPNLNGSYLVACAVFNTLYQEPLSPTLFNGGVSNANAIYFQGITDNIILNNKILWRINTYNLHADFSIIQNNSSVNFDNLSSNYQNLIWDFGDGYTSNESNPSHNYLNTGNYTTTLTVFRNGCSETFQKNITIGTLQADNFNNLKISLYPTLINEEVFIESNLNTKGILFNQLGQKIKTIEINSGKNNFSFTYLSSGIYFIKINNDVLKFIKK